MSKKRIYEYAKEQNVKSKDVIDELKAMDIDVSSHMQTLEDSQIKALDQKYNKQAQPSQDKKEKSAQNLSLIHI